MSNIGNVHRFPKTDVLAHNRETLVSSLRTVATSVKQEWRKHATHKLPVLSGAVAEARRRESVHGHYPHNHHFLSYGCLPLVVFFSPSTVCFVTLV